MFSIMPMPDIIRVRAKSSYIINIIFIDFHSPAYHDGPMKTLSRLYIRLVGNLRT